MIENGFEQIRREVVEAGGIKCFEMQDLKEASRYKRLGPGVNEEIEAALKQKALGHGPLGLYQHETVYVFDPGTKAGTLMLAVTGTASENGAEEILKAVAPDTQGHAAQAQLDDLKALLVQMQDVFDVPPLASAPAKAA